MLRASGNTSHSSGLSPAAAWEPNRGTGVPSPSSGSLPPPSAFHIFLKHTSQENSPPSKAKLY